MKTLFDTQEVREVLQKINGKKRTFSAMAIFIMHKSKNKRLEYLDFVVDINEFREWLKIHGYVSDALDGTIERYACHYRCACGNGSVGLKNKDHVIRARNNLIELGAKLPLEIKHNTAITAKSLTFTDKETSMRSIDNITLPDVKNDRASSINEFLKRGPGNININININIENYHGYT